MTRKRPRPRGAASDLAPHVPSILATAASLQQIMSHGINLDGSLSPECLRSLLKLKNITISSLAKSSGHVDAQYHQVINREYRNEAIENTIARALGLESSSDRIWGRTSTTAA